MHLEDEGYFVSFIEGEPEENELLVEELFVGEVPIWAARKAKINDFVIPEHVYIEPGVFEPHKVFFVEHHMLDPATEVRVKKHHVVCDCVNHRNFNDGRQGIDTSICEVMERALVARAKYIDAQLGLAAMLEFREIPDLSGSGKQIEYDDMVLEAMKNVLILDRGSPERWHGNPVSGEHRVPLLGEIIRKPPEEAHLYAGILEMNGQVVVEDETIRLAA